MKWRIVELKNNIITKYRIQWKFWWWPLWTTVTVSDGPLQFYNQGDAENYIKCCERKKKAMKTNKRIIHV